MRSALDLDRIRRAEGAARLLADLLSEIHDLPDAEVSRALTHLGRLRQQLDHVKAQVKALVPDTPLAVSEEDWRGMRCRVVDCIRERGHAGTHLFKCCDPRCKGRAHRASYIPHNHSAAEEVCS